MVKVALLSQQVRPSISLVIARPVDTMVVPTIATMVVPATLLAWVILDSPYICIN